MKSKLIGAASSIVLILLLLSGAFVDLVRFFAWLFNLQYTAPETSIGGGIVVRILTFLLSFGLVGVIFNVLGWFNSKAMSIVYLIISTLIGFALAYVVWTIETHILIIGIIMGILLVGVAVYYLTIIIVKRHNTSLRKSSKT